MCTRSVFPSAGRSDALSPPTWAVSPLGIGLVENSEKPAGFVLGHPNSSPQPCLPSVLEAPAPLSVMTPLPFIPADVVAEINEFHKLIISIQHLNAYRNDPAYADVAANALEVRKHKGKIFKLTVISSFLS
jgi:hypothetical protein